jgi:phosphomethylpyrimidine synthase
MEDSVQLIDLQDICEGIITVEKLREKLDDGSAVVLKGKQRSVAVGSDLLIKVNVNIGANEKKAIAQERKKVKVLSRLGYRPDTVMDLSIVRLPKPIYEIAIEEFGGPVGTLPHYLCYHSVKGIDPHLLLEEIEKQAEAGVSWMTLHVTPRKDLYEKAKKIRQIPCTSRGGGIVIKDMYINERSESVISLYFNDILSVMARYKVTLSIGTAFRPATTIDALDKIHLKEILIQGEYIRAARNKGVQVMMEGVGHITLNKLQEYVHIVRSKYNIPLVPLGPIPTDAAGDEDHIASAIGAAYMSLLGGAHMINAITCEEHTGDVPSLDSIVKGLKAARVAAHSVNISRFPQLDVADRAVVNKRGKNYTCVIEGGLFTESAKMRFDMGCGRCRHECPLLINYTLRKYKGNNLNSKNI